MVALGTPRPWSIRLRFEALRSAWRARSLRPAILLPVGFVFVRLQAAELPELPPLGSGPESPRLPGKFVWADLATDNPAAAQQFYAKLFGWKFTDLGGYSIGLNEGWPLAGIYHRPRAIDGSAEPQWFGYISVSDVGRAEKTVTNAGGQVLTPRQERPVRGEQAVFADPEGARFGVVKSSTGDPEDFLAIPGDWIWMQLLSRDAKKASEFYRDVAGYEVIENPVRTQLSDYLLASEGYARATVRSIPASVVMLKPMWLPFVRVNDVKQSVALAKQYGGTAWIEPRSDFFQGKVAVIKDPTGAAIGIIEWNPDAQSGGGYPDDPDLIVTLPPCRPQGRPHPAHPIVLPPSGIPIPTPLPSIPTTPRVAPRGGGGRR